MSKEQEAIKVHILDKEYLVACPDGEADALLASARYLNDKMLDVRKTGKVVGVDRIAVMTALNLAHEVIDSGGGDGSGPGTCGARIRTLNSRIETALGKHKLKELN